MSLLIETIKVKDGRIYNCNNHNERFNRTRKKLFGIGSPIDLSNKIVIPVNASKGLFKCRITYDSQIRDIEFIPYSFRSIVTIRIVEAGKLDYSFKFINREGLDKLFSQRFGCDDILIVKNGKITDTYYANVVLKGENNIWYTPSSFLLPGTKRAYLLDKGCIVETEVTPTSLHHFKELRLINSMIDISDTMGISISNISF